MIPLDGTRWQVQQGCVTRTKRNRLLLPQSQSRYWLTTVIFTTSRIYYHLFTPSNNPFLSSLAKHCECNVHCSFIYTLSQLAISSRAAQGHLTVSSRSARGPLTVKLRSRSRDGAFRLGWIFFVRIIETKSMRLPPHFYWVHFQMLSLNCEKRLLASSCLYVRPSFCPHRTIRFQLDKFWLNLISELFRNSCRENSSFVQIRQE